MITWSKVRAAYPDSAGYTDEECSKEAAAKINRKRTELQKTILRAFIAFPMGCTVDQMAEQTGIDRQTVASRLTELKIDGFVEKTKERGVTIKGGACAIWKSLHQEEYIIRSETD